MSNHVNPTHPIYPHPIFPFNRLLPDNAALRMERAGAVSVLPAARVDDLG